MRRLAVVRRGGRDASSFVPRRARRTSTRRRRAARRTAARRRSTAGPRAVVAERQNALSRRAATSRSGQRSTRSAQHRGRGLVRSPRRRRRGSSAYTLFRTVRMESGDELGVELLAAAQPRSRGPPRTTSRRAGPTSGCYALGDAHGLRRRRASRRAGSTSGALHRLRSTATPAAARPAAGANADPDPSRRLRSCATVSDPVFTGTPSGDLLDATAAGQRRADRCRSRRPTAAAASTSARSRSTARSWPRWVVDDNGGRCREAVHGRGAVQARRRAASLSYDTAALADGQHSVRLVVTDATETNAVAYGPVQVTTANQSASCVARHAPELAARFASTRRSALTRRGGRALTADRDARRRGAGHVGLAAQPRGADRRAAGRRRPAR